MNGFQSVFVLVGAIGVTMPFLAVGLGRPWLRQSLGRWRSGWWALAAAVAFALASICLTFVLLVGAAPPDSRVGELEAAVPWLGRTVGPGGWAFLIIAYLTLTGAASVIGWRRGRWTPLPATVDASSLRRLVLDGRDQNELRDLYAQQFPGGSFDSIIALAECSREARRLVKEAAMRYTRALGGLTATGACQMVCVRGGAPD